MTCLPTKETEVLVETRLSFLWSKFTVFTKFGQEVRGGFQSVGRGSGGTSHISRVPRVWSLLILGRHNGGLALIVLSFLGLPSGGFMGYLRASFPIASIDSLG
jgi:hypothetical protein